MVSCTLKLSDVNHHPVDGIMPRQGSTVSKVSKQHLDHAWFRSYQKSITFLTVVSWQFNPTEGGLLEEETKAVPSEEVSQVQEGPFESTRFNLIYLPNNQKKKILLNPCQLSESRKEKNGCFSHPNTPHGRWVLDWAFLWVAVQLKTIFYNRMRTALILLLIWCEEFHTCIFFLDQ